MLKALLPLALLILSIQFLGSGCGQVGMPTGGDKDTIAPSLNKAVPAEYSVNVSSNKAAFTFSEFIEMDNIAQNVIVSPVQKRTPNIDYNLNTITVKFRDTLKPNTTYSIDFGNAIKDVNEGNVFRHFVYAFSTGPHIDSLALSGNVVMAENGLPDTTLQVLLYRSATDSAVYKTLPDYITRVDSKGDFTFNYLPAGPFHIYALKDADGSRNYSFKNEGFAFLPDDSAVYPGTAKYFKLRAYVEKPVVPAATSSATAAKTLRYTLSTAANQDLTKPLRIDFNMRVDSIDRQKLILTDTNFTRPLDFTLGLDTAAEKAYITAAWAAETSYNLSVSSGVFYSKGKTNDKADTLRIAVRPISSYGNILLNFTNLQLSEKPVLQLLQGEELVYSIPLAGNAFQQKLINPAEYAVRILYDLNGDGVWTTGSYEKNRQPERVITLPEKLTVKADWDTERSIVLD